ncbi:hypothetical protein [Nocardioides aequoreus]|uniref:hypothetical protein n=1 Tax=Nocardioides aequoreus TaxID=397278 RepID=UPI0004C3F6F4|nr:hypothetical protein [Nocardioides aequoreus]
MSTAPAPAAAPRATPSTAPADHVVDALVDARLLDPAVRERARDVVVAALRHPGERRTAQGTSSLIEVVAYLGTALVLAAGGLFGLTFWGDLSFGAQVTLLAVAGLALAAGGIGLVVAGTGHDGRRRLAGTLLTGAAMAIAGLVGLVVDRAGGTPDWQDPGLDLTTLSAALAGLVVVVVGYRLAPTALGLLGTGAAVTTVAATLVGPVPSDVEAPALALALLVTALGWLALAERGTFGEPVVARVLGVALALVAAQVPVFDSDWSWLAYLLTAGVVVGGMLAYVTRHSWPYLAVAVVAVTVVVPEAVTDWTDGGLGAVGAVLLTGVTLLLASLLGAWLRARRTP